MDNILRDLIPPALRGNVTRSPNSVEDVGKLDEMVEDIRGAMMDYQASPRGPRRYRTQRPHLTSAPDVIAARYLWRELSTH